MDGPLVNDAMRPTSQPPAGELTFQRAYVGTPDETAALLPASHRHWLPRATPWSETRSHKGVRSGGATSLAILMIPS